MKKLSLFFAFLAIAVLALAGCASSISQEDYDAVVAERDQLRQDLEATSAQRDQLQQELDAASAETSLDFASSALADLEGLSLSEASLSTGKKILEIWMNAGGTAEIELASSLGTRLGELSAEAWFDYNAVYIILQDGTFATPKGIVAYDTTTWDYAVLAPASSDAAGNASSSPAPSESAPVQTAAPSQEPSSDGEITVSQSNAVRAAKDYLEFMAFSREGLIEQLEYEGYSTADATYGVDNSGADWMEQAVKSAEEYLEFMPFSREGLIEQLEYEGFTHEEAVHGVDAAGL